MIADVRFTFPSLPIPLRNGPRDNFSKLSPRIVHHGICSMTAMEYTGTSFLRQPNGWAFTKFLLPKNSAAILSAPLTLFRVVVCRQVPTVAGSVLETQSVHLQVSVFPVGTLVPLPALWHCNGAGIGRKGRVGPVLYLNLLSGRLRKSLGPLGTTGRN